MGKARFLTKRENWLSVFLGRAQLPVPTIATVVRKKNESTLLLTEPGKFMHNSILCFQLTNMFSVSLNEE